MERLWTEGKCLALEITGTTGVFSGVLTHRPVAQVFKESLNCLVSDSKIGHRVQALTSLLFYSSFYSIFLNTTAEGTQLFEQVVYEGLCRQVDHVTDKWPYIATGPV